MKALLTERGVWLFKMMLIVLTFVTQQITSLPSSSVFVFLHQSATFTTIKKRQCWKISKTDSTNKSLFKTNSSYTNKNQLGCLNHHIKTPSQPILKHYELQYKNMYPYTLVSLMSLYFAIPSLTNSNKQFALYCVYSSC